MRKTFSREQSAKASEGEGGPIRYGGRWVEEKKLSSAEPIPDRASKYCSRFPPDPEQLTSSRSFSNLRQRDIDTGLLRARYCSEVQTFRCMMGSCSHSEFEGPIHSSYPPLESGAIELTSRTPNPSFRRKPDPPLLSDGPKSLHLMPIDERTPQPPLTASRRIRKPV